MLLANSENLTPQPPSLQGKGEGSDPYRIDQHYRDNREQTPHPPRLAFSLPLRSRFSSHKPVISRHFWEVKQMETKSYQVFEPLVAPLD